MKFTSIVVLIVLVAFAISPTCIKSNYCMGCHKTTANFCTSCFNWAKGKIGAKALNGTVTVHNCITSVVPAVSNARTYSGTSSTTQTVYQLGHVYKCKTSYMNYDNNATVKTLTCTKKGATAACKKIKNCDNSSLCYKATATASYNTCYLCKKGYAAGSLNVNAANTNVNCSKSKTVANCNWEYRGATVMQCLQCKSKYAVKLATNNVCVSYSTDKNCRSLFDDGSACSNCFWAYYWDNTKCKLAAKVIFVGAIMALINFLF